MDINMNTNDTARTHRHVGAATAATFLVLLLLGALHHSAHASIPATAPAPAATSSVPAPTQPGQVDPNLVPRGRDGFGRHGGGDGDGRGGGGGRFGGGGDGGVAPTPTPTPAPAPAPSASGGSTT
jgi:uncharacterized membrane protein YgcG